MDNDIKKLFKDFIKNNLNPTQKKAVLKKDGSVLVVAGAGSGKTRVITARITNLIINEGVSAHSIVALTFTNKAAREMQERIFQFLGKDTPMPFIGTFHSYCVNLLKKNQELLENPFFSILDQDDQKKLIHGIIQRHGLNKEITAKSISYQISSIKNQIANPDQLTSAYAKQPMYEQIFMAYEREKKASKCLDFDDLLLETLKLFKKEKGFKQQFQNTVSHIMVDEYQDTNVVQHELLKQMAKDGKKVVANSICVVGDEDQSIYSWRGATIANILNFKKDFPKTTTIKIEQNYRSVQPILETANHLIKQNKYRNPKTLWSDKKASDRVRVVTCLSEYQEGDIITQFLKVIEKEKNKAKEGKVVKLSDCAILYRTHFQSRAIEEALLKQSIPYKIIGGVQFYERKEIKDLLAYLKLVANPFDRASFFRIINSPTRGLGAKFEKLFYEQWHNETFLTFIDIAKKLIADGAVKKTKATTVKQFISIFDGLNATDKPSAALDIILSRAGYLNFITKQYEKEEAETRIDNIKELLNGIKHFEENGTETVTQFLEEVTLMQEKMNNKDEDHDAVLLMTLHAVKGLEFNTVIITGLEEGLLPSSRSLQDEKNVEEERRLFYVGVTRAKERLLITHARYRYSYGNMVDQLSSRFLDDLPSKVITSDDCSYWKSIKLNTYFSDWLGIKAAPNPFSVFTFGGAKSDNSKSHRVEKNFSKKTTTKKRTFIKKTTTIKASNYAGGSHWRRNQPVKHPTFGIGLVKEIEKKGTTKTYLTIQFKAQLKKLDAKFVTAV